MCLACSLPAADGHWSTAGLAPAGPLAWPRPDPHLALLTGLLGAEGLTVRRVGATLLITAPSGRAARAATIDDVWPAVQSLTGHAVDPLGPGGHGEPARS